MIVTPQSIQTKHIFGLKSDTNGGVFHIDEQKVIYTAGHNVVIYSPEEKQQQFFPGLSNSLGITAITLSPLRRHLAVAEKSDQALIVVYDTHTQRKKRQMSTGEVLSSEYISLAFAPGQENKYLISLGGAPDWQLVFWQWDRPRVQAMISVSTSNPAYMTSFNLLDYNHGIIVTGNDLFRWYKPLETSLKPQATDIHGKTEALSTNYLSHSWIKDGRLVVGTDSAQILILDSNCEFLGYLEITIENFQVTTLLHFEKGFLVGGNKGKVLIFDSYGDERKPDYKQRPRVITVAHPEKQASGTVKALSLSFQTEESLAIVLDNAQIYSIDFNSMNEEALPLSHLFHTGAITGLDVCVRKPLIVTCGSDSSVRIWNYLEKTLEVYEFFNEEPLSVAFHPSGFHIVVGFLDKLRMMNVFNKTIEKYKDIPLRACSEVRFSNGGHLFAAVVSNYIKVFNFYTGENPPNMEYKNHSGKVRSIYWSEDDSSFVSAGNDGTIFEWKLYSVSGVLHPQEYHHKGVFYTSVIFTSEIADDHKRDKSREEELRKIYAVGNDRLLKVLPPSEDFPPKETDGVVGQIAISRSGKLLFAGYNDSKKTGAVRCYKMPAFTGEDIEYQGHSKGIERIRVSFDDSFLFTVSQDGSLIIWDIKDRDVRTARRDKDLSSMPFSEEILITANDTEELHQMIENLRTSNRDMITNNKMQYEMNIQDREDLIDKLREQLTNDAQQDKNKYDSLAESKREIEQQYEEKMRNLKDKYDNEKQEIETKQQQNFMIEVGRYQELSREKEIENKAAEDKIRNLEREHSNLLDRQKVEGEQQLKEEKLEIDRLKKENSDQRKRCGMIEEQLVTENKEEVDDHKSNNEKDTKAIKEESLKAKGKLTMAKRKEAMLKQEKERLEDDLKVKQEEYARQKQLIETQTERINRMKRQVDDKEKEIGDREKKIYELKQENQNLEKFKFVLDYKIRELKQEIGPREEEIAKMKEKTSVMDGRLKFLSSLNESLGGFMDELCQRQEKMQKEIGDQRTHIRETTNRIKAMKNGIYDCAQSIQDYRNLKELILKLFKKFVKTDGKAQEPDTEKEFARQCEYLQNSINVLRTQLKDVQETHNKEKMKRMKVNQELIEEIYKLRKERTAVSGDKKKYEMLTKKSKERKNPRDEENERILEMQREEIKMLRNKIMEIENARPGSHEKLPPIDNGTWPQD